MEQIRPDLEILCKGLVVLLSVGGLRFLIAVSTLNPSVYNHDCRPKPWLQLSLCILLVWLRANIFDKIFGLGKVVRSFPPNETLSFELKKKSYLSCAESYLPGSINDVKHAWLWWLRIRVEPVVKKKIGKTD